MTQQEKEIKEKIEKDMDIFEEIDNFGESLVN